METVAFCEIEEFPRKVLAKHWPGVKCYTDVRTLTAERLKDDGIGAVDVITGGFPCQDVSIAGKREGIEGERTGLWTELHRIISELRPRYAIMENVTGLLSGDNGKWFGRILGDLAEIGYDAEWHCIEAAYVGAPHYRDRVWIVAYPNKVRLQGRSKEWEDQRIKTLSEVETWRDLPASIVCGGDDGIPDRAHRLAAIGNAVVPQIPEIIGRAIMEIENANPT